MRIGELAKAARIGIETIRYYERRGLLPPAHRRASGYRDYCSEDVVRLRFVRRAKELGFTLSEIKELLALRVDHRASCGRVRQRAERKIADIDERVASLKEIRRALDRLVASCSRGDAPTSACPILDALEDEEESSDTPEHPPRTKRSGSGAAGSRRRTG